MAELTTKKTPGPVLGAFGVWLNVRWDQARHVLAVIHDTRFSFFVVVTAIVALLLNDQGREIAVRGGDSWRDLVWYPVSTGLLAFQVWFWARIILSIEHPRVEGRPQSIVVDHFPRWLGVAGAVIPIVAVGAAWLDGQAGEHVLWLLIALLITLTLFSIFVIYRRDIAKSRLARKILKDETKLATLDSHENAYNRGFIRFSLVQAIGLTAWAWASPRSFGATLGAAPALLMGLETIVCVGSWFVLKTHGSKFPIVSFLVVSGLILSSCDPHYFRELNSFEKDTRHTLAEEFASWKSATPAGDSRPTMVVVSASGGGITAAYWTSSVLSQLRELDNQFSARLFSISAVSGGSVGTAAFTQALACEAAAKDAFRKRVEGSLHGDLLAPTIGTALFNDAVFWFPPLSILAHYEIKLPDRAVTFEEQLERQWREKFPPDCAGLDASFLGQRSAASGQPWRPIMLLNSTHQETGRPVVMSQVKLTTAGAAQPFESAIDYFALAARDLRISTAALNSARFPLVSPAGQVRYEDKPPQLRLGHLIDGGYFENDGAFTTLRVLESLSEELRDVRVIVIQISIDSPEAFERPPRTDPPQRTRDRSYLADRVAHQAHFANELLAPVYGFFATRDGHQAAARDALKRWATTRGENAVYVHFRALIPRKTKELPNPAEPPLGWLLSNGSVEQLSTRTLCLDRNHAEWLRLATALGVSAGLLARCGDSEPLHKDVDRGFPP